MIITEINDVSLGKAIVLVIETDEIIEKERLELLSRIKSLVGPYSCPKHIYAINSIPRTLNGKVNRLALKELIT
jgi:acyl-coenzyme A synthetase/AMP-(fatty) acid ligase